MKLAEIKKSMLAWRDFYGADISNSDDIKRARTKRECVAILSQYALLMEAQHQDAMHDLDKFRKSLGLDIKDSSCDVMSELNNLLLEAVEGHE